MGRYAYEKYTVLEKFLRTFLVMQKLRIIFMGIFSSNIQHKT